MSVIVVESQTLGAGWLDVTRAVLEQGALARYDGQRTRELSLLTLVVERPSSDDETIARLGDPEWLAWMHENFVGRKDVAEARRPTALRACRSTSPRSSVCRSAAS